MASVLWLILLLGLSLLIFRWLFAWNPTPISRQAVRHLLLQRLLATFPTMELLTEQADHLTLRIDEQICAIHLDQLYRRCQEHPSRVGLCIRHATHALQQALTESVGLTADWERTLVPLLLATDHPLPPDAFTRSLTEQLAIGYALASPLAFRWVTNQDLDEANVLASHLHDTAMRNLERSCNALVIETPQINAEGDDRLLRFATGDGLDAARLLLPSFYQRFSPRFDDADLLIAIPTRDSLVMIAAPDHALAGILGWQSARECAQRAYPLLGSLLHLDESGLRHPHHSHATEVAT